MGNGVGMLMQLLQQDQADRQRAAFFDAQQQAQQQERQYQQNQQQGQLATQLRAQMLMHGMDDTARQNTDTVNYNRQVAADAAHWARVKEAEDQRNARDDARWNAYLKAAALRAGAQTEAADIAGKSRVAAANVPRVSKHYGYSINERRGGTTGPGQQPDVRRTPEWNNYERASKDAIAFEDAYSKYGQIVGQPPPPELLSARQRKMLTQKMFDDKFGQAARAAAESTITTGPGMLAVPPDQQGAPGLFR